jgi:hypothetical protein
VLFLANVPEILGEEAIGDKALPVQERHEDIAAAGSATSASMFLPKMFFSFMVMFVIMTGTAATLGKNSRKSRPGGKRVWPRSVS